MIDINKINRYSRLIEDIFFQKYKEGDTRVCFQRNDFEIIAKNMNVSLPKNLGDIIYSFRFRTDLPETIKATAIEGKEWVIKSVGRALYAFELVVLARIKPDEMLIAIKIPEATPGIVARYALNDEQALLTKVRYNRLLDIFSGVTCYSLQNHLRTTVVNIGQIETDELYVGVDKLGRQFIFPVQAKGGNDEISVVQIEQDIMLCRDKYPELLCRSIATQFIDSNKIAIFEWTLEEGQVRKLTERHYQLVPPSEILPEELAKYNQATD